MLQLFEQGELDWAGSPFVDIPLSALKNLKRERAIFARSKAGGIFQLKLNVEQSPLHNVNLRRALSAAINRQALVHKHHAWGREACL